jgi:hypothetical protein
MSVLAQLTAAVQVRVQRELAFKEEIVNKINAIIARLAVCDASAGQLDLTQEQLDQVLASIQDTRILDDAESTRISNLISNLRKDPVPARSPGFLGALGNLFGSAPPTAPAPVEEPAPTSPISLRRLPIPGSTQGPTPRSIQRQERREARRQIPPQPTPILNTDPEHIYRLMNGLPGGTVPDPDGITHFGGKSKRTRRR